MVVLVALAISCAHRVEYTTISPSGQRLCILHKIPLITVDGFCVPEGTIVDPTHEYMVFAPSFPNHIPVTCSLESNEWNNVPTKITYCPQCEQELAKKLETRLPR